MKQNPHLAVLLPPCLLALIIIFSIIPTGTADCPLTFYPRKTMTGTRYLTQAQSQPTSTKARTDSSHISTHYPKIPKLPSDPVLPLQLLVLAYREKPSNLAIASKHHSIHPPIMLHSCLKLQQAHPHRWINGDILSLGLFFQMPLKSSLALKMFWNLFTPKIPMFSKFPSTFPRIH